MRSVSLIKGLSLVTSSLIHSSQGCWRKKNSHIFTPLLGKHFWKIFYVNSFWKWETPRITIHLKMRVHLQRVLCPQSPCTSKIGCRQPIPPVSLCCSRLSPPRHCPELCLCFTFGSKPQGLQQHHPHLNFSPSEPPNIQPQPRNARFFQEFSLAGCRVLALLQLTHQILACQGLQQNHLSLKTWVLC